MSIKRGPSSQNEDTIIRKRPRAILPQDVNIPEGIDHAIMDETVLNTLDPRTELSKGEDLSENDLTALLSTIILVERASNGSSPKLLGLQLPKTIVEHPMIRDALQLAWRNQSFKDIRMSSVYINVQLFNQSLTVFSPRVFSLMRITL